VTKEPIKPEESQKNDDDEDFLEEPEWPDKSLD